MLRDAGDWWILDPLPPAGTVLNDPHLRSLSHHQIAPIPDTPYLRTPTGHPAWGVLTGRWWFAFLPEHMILIPSRTSEEDRRQSVTALNPPYYLVEYKHIRKEILAYQAQYTSDAPHDLHVLRTQHLRTTPSGAPHPRLKHNGVHPLQWTKVLGEVHRAPVAPADLLMRWPVLALPPGSKNHQLTTTAGNGSGSKTIATPGRVGSLVRGCWRCVAAA